MTEVTTSQAVDWAQQDDRFMQLVDLTENHTPQQRLDLLAAVIGNHCNGCPVPEVCLTAAAIIAFDVSTGAYT